jgi:hypothetical protein
MPTDDAKARASCEQASYERAILDSEIKRRRDRLRREHLENMRTILGKEAAE